MRRAGQQSVSPYRRGASGPRDAAAQQKKTTPNRGNRTAKAGASRSFASGSISGQHHTPTRDNNKFSSIIPEPTKLQELQQNTEQLFGELRKANEKKIQLQVENRKLLDQVHVLNLQVEDLRIHNNRYQIQA